MCYLAQLHEMNKRPVYEMVSSFKEADDRYLGEMCFQA